MKYGNEVKETCPEVCALHHPGMENILLTSPVPMNLNLAKRILLNKGALWISYLKLIPILNKLDKNSVVLDCGANIGDITKKFAGTGATVYSFEPDKVAFEILQKRFKNYKNVNLINKGVWDRNAEIALYSHKEQHEKQKAYTVSSSIVSSKLNIDTEKKQTIEVVDLIGFIESLEKKIQIIKLDVEGAEIEILKRIIEKETYQLFDMMYVETHETKIPGQKAELIFINEMLEKKNISNIKLNWL